MEWLLIVSGMALVFGLVKMLAKAEERRQHARQWRAFR